MDWVTFTEEILNGKLHFCAVIVLFFIPRLKHPNIVGLIEMFDNKDKLYLIMEL